MIVWTLAHIDKFLFAVFGIGTVLDRFHAPSTGRDYLHGLTIGKTALIVGYAVNGMMAFFQVDRFVMLSRISYVVFLFLRKESRPPDNSQDGYYPGKIQQKAILRHTFSHLQSLISSLLESHNGYLSGG